MNDSHGLFVRDCGILVHPSSLPNEFGIGDFGSSSVRWVRRLAEAGQNLWQILPLNPAGYGDSPYQSLSAFAANPLFLSPESIYSIDLISKEDFESLKLPIGETVDYESVHEKKRKLSELAAHSFFARDSSDPLRRKYEDFLEREKDWLEDFALFSALKASFGGIAWSEWPDEFRDRDSATLRKAEEDLHGDLQRVKLEQFLLRRQWNAVREVARINGVRIIGDLPIFVAHDSVDVWCNRELFLLDDDGMPEVVAGVPPDYFSETGQRWGNPLYNWDSHRSNAFAWWRARVKQILTWVDIVRIDHFRGFEACWEVPAYAETAKEGKWVSAPGHEIFQRFTEDWGLPLPFIAEDLGVITPEVEKLRDRFELPGIRIEQFAFGSDPMKQTFLPESYIPRSVAYTGTHDNDTVVGWFESVAGEGSTRSEAEVHAEREEALAYFGSDGYDIHFDFILRLFRSDCGAAIVPIQDVLGLGSEARMNTPGKPSGSWRWKLADFERTDSALKRIESVTLEVKRGLHSTVAQELAS